jgi:hypothetical protein
MKTETEIRISEKLEFGEVTIRELMTLKSVGRTRIYEDIKAGRLPILKRGRATRIAGHIARAYAPTIGVVGHPPLASKVSKTS